MDNVIKNKSTKIIDNYYNECLKFNGILQQDFDITSAEEAISYLYELYKKGLAEGKFMPDPDYVAKASDLIISVEENSDNKYYSIWRIWFRYFVSMGYSGWNELWGAVKGK